MATDKSFVDFLVDQIENAGAITYKKMFGEYAIYSDGKVVAFACDNQLFMKPTSGGRAFIAAGDAADLIEAPPYTGAKMYFLIDGKFEDREWISELIRITAGELPEPKPRAERKKKIEKNKKK